MGVATSTTARMPSQRAGTVEDKSEYLSRWLKVWVALITVVTLVVVVFLVVITNSLASINDNLATAEDAVTGAGSDVTSLPDQVESINSSLVDIDAALKPVPGQADQIIAAATSINDRLTAVNSSLVDTDASLIDTNSSLTSTSSVLVSVLGRVGSIRDLLIDADDPPDQLGVQNIHRRVDVINFNPNGLAAAEGDAQNIIAGLDSVIGSLSGICGSTALQLNVPTLLNGPCVP